MAPLPFTTIESERLRLRRFRADDLPALLAYRNDPEVARFQGWQALSAADVQAFVAAMAVAEPTDPGGFQFAVARRADDQLLGDVFLRLLDHDRAQAEIGYSLARAHQGQGYASEAVRALFGYAFDTLGLHRVMAMVDCANLPSIALLERLEMRREGQFIQHYFFKGSYRDEYQYALLGSEWRPR